MDTKVVFLLQKGLNGAVRHEKLNKMKTQRFFLMAMMLLLLVLCSFSHENGVHRFIVTDTQGATVALSTYKGKVLLIVNTATKCAFTPQYAELERIYEQYKTQGFEILDFPCNQFGNQAPGSDAKINTFCTMKYNTAFPRFSKIEVNGENAHPLYKYLKAQKGFDGFGTGKKATFLNRMLSKKDPNYAEKSDIKWNFTKFLIDREGNVLQRFEPTTDMQVVEAAIKVALKETK